LEKDERTVAIKGSRMHLNITLANILLKGSEKEHKLVAKCLKETYREDWTEGKVIKY
jgi:hypothetical protein